MFASKTAEQAGFEPRPYRFYFSGQPTKYSAGDHTYLDVANQWRGVQSIEPNRILTYFRGFLRGKTGEDFRQECLSLIDALGDSQGYENLEIEHAYKVLDRLSRLV